MLTSIAKRSLDAFEREWDYDVTYMREVLDAGGVAALAPMQALQKVSAYRGGAPVELRFAASIVAGRAADCGPCLQLGVRMAERSGMPVDQIRAVLSADRDAMNDVTRLGYDFARCVLARDGWDTPARDEIVRRFGKKALIEVSYAFAVAAFYPAFKYAFGAGHACQRISVGNAELVPATL